MTHLLTLGKAADQKPLLHKLKLLKNEIRLLRTIIVKEQEVGFILL